MSRRKMTVFTVGVAAAIVFMLIIALIYLNTPVETPKVSLPDNLSENILPSGNPTGGINVGDDLKRIEVNPKTVQTAIATLERPESYYRLLTIERFWGDGEKAEYKIKVWVSDGNTKITVLQDGFDSQNILVTPEKIAIWYDGSQELYESVRWDGEALLYTSDGYQQMLTYEDILMLDSNEIFDAGYKEKNGDYYLYVLTKDELLGYQVTYYISIESGLLSYAEKLENGKAVYLMAVIEESFTEPDPDIFLNPEM
ncbi:MAG: hypothetical protein GX111_07125 [Clostridiales bacterium]|jgi:hypothetical protein|nr:hypothetical protein [Clostridiales bacterium]